MSADAIESNFEVEEVLANEESSRLKALTAFPWELEKIKQHNRKTKQMQNKKRNKQEEGKQEGARAGTDGRNKKSIIDTKKKDNRVIPKTRLDLLPVASSRQEKSSRKKVICF